MTNRPKRSESSKVNTNGLKLILSRESKFWNIESEERENKSRSKMIPTTQS